MHAATRALAALDPVLEHRIRLATCSLLSRTNEISFARFKQLLDATDGNLGAQLRTLEDAGYVSMRKEFVDRKPVTWYRLTAHGRGALRSHIRAVQGLFQLGSGDS